MLVLFIAGSTPHSLRAIRSIRKLCEEHLADCRELEIVDIYSQPELARWEGILAVPTLIRDLRVRLEEAEEVLSAIRRGEVDALVFKPGDRPQVWSVNGVEQVRVLFETLNEGALTLGPDGAILYCNSQFAGR